MPYQKVSEAPANIRKLRPDKDSESISLTLEQVNWIANVADGISKGNPDIQSPWAVAISNFKKSFEVKDGKWIKKKKEEMSEIKLYDRFLTFNEILVVLRD